MAEYVAAPEGIARAARATALDALFRRRPVDAQHAAFVRRVRELLSDVSLEAAETAVPVWDWIQIAVSRHPEHTRGVQRYLGLHPSGFESKTSPATRHRYRYKTVLAGAGGKMVVGGGVHTGLMTIEKLAPDRWSAGFSATQLSVSAGKDVGWNFGGESSWSEFETPFPYEPRNFVGRYSVVEGVKGMIGPIEYIPEGAALMVFHGDGLFPPLHVDGSGYTKVFGVGLGGSAGMVGGYLTRDEPRPRISRRLTEPPQRIEQEARYGARPSAYFAVNSPRLTPEGRDELRRSVARHRAALSDGRSTVLIEGYASRSGSEWHNFELTYLRAANVRQHLMDFLGDDLRAVAELRAHGEEAAAEAGAPEGQESEAWRVVDLEINGVVVLRL
jgi:hypothetical protein